MGKKAGKASSSSPKINDKKQLNSLIRVLRPKVYITDTSSFKTLVQELTGNGTTTSPDIQPAVEKLPSVIDHAGPGDILEPSMDASVVASLELYKQVGFTEEASDNPSWMNTQQEDYLWAYQDLESWLLDSEPYPYYNCHIHELQQELSVYE